MNDHVDRMVRDAYALAEKALDGWCAQANMTREEWLKHWRPAVSWDTDPANPEKMICRVRAVAVEDRVTGPGGWLHAPEDAPTGGVLVP